jgi:hypothetical protein
MMKERENDPEYQRMIQEMIKDGSIQENMELDSDDEKQKSAQTIIDLDDDEMQDLEELR